MRRRVGNDKRDRSEERLDWEYRGVMDILVGNKKYRIQLLTLAPLVSSLFSPSSSSANLSLSYPGTHDSVPSHSPQI